MKVECIICMELFESSDTISACQCGHVFHQECIVRWLSRDGLHSIGKCPQCRTVIDEFLTRLYFTDSSSTADVKQRNIDELQARIALDTKRILELTGDCRRKEETIEELTDDCRHKQNAVVALNAECRQKKDKIDELTYECRRKAWIIDELTVDCQQKDVAIEELNDASERKDVTIATLSNSNQQRADLIVEQTARINQLTKELE